MRSRSNGCAADLERTEDLRVLDFNGHHIFNRFSFSELGDPIMCGEGA